MAIITAMQEHIMDAVADCMLNQACDTTHAQFSLFTRGGHAEDFCASVYSRTWASSTA
jgi:hypothetical protein